MTHRIGTIAVILMIAHAAGAGADETSRAPAQEGRDAGTIDVTTIEGEIPLPQVWFFSSRERMERVDRYHMIYLKPIARIGAEVELPIRIRMAPTGLSTREGL